MNMEENGSADIHTCAAAIVSALRLKRPIPEARILQFRDFAGRVSTDSLASARIKDISALLAGFKKFNEESIEIACKLIGLFPELCSGQSDSEPNAGELAEKLQLLMKLDSGEINPTQVRYSRKKMLGEYLVDMGVISREQLDETLAQQNSGKFPGLRIGDILQKKGVITRAQLDQAIELQMLDAL
jgi:hypothetical protein